MIKRISMDAKIVLEKAGYEVKETLHNRRGIPGALEVTRNAFFEELPIIQGCIDNEKIEELLDFSKKWNKSA